MRVSLLCGAVFLACTPQRAAEPAVAEAGAATTEPTAPDASTSHAARADAGPKPPTTTFDRYPKLCPELATVGRVEVVADGGMTAPREDANSVVARFKRKNKELVASIAVPSRHIERDVFHIGEGADPYGCCSRASEDALEVTCTFSGVSFIESRARASIDGGALVIRWCDADLSVNRVRDRGEERLPLADAGAPSFRSAVPACTRPVSVPR